MRTIEVTDQELQALGALLDAAVRHLGLQGAQAAVIWKAKIEQSKEIEEPAPAKPNKPNKPK